MRANQRIYFNTTNIILFCIWFQFTILKSSSELQSLVSFLLFAANNFIRSQKIIHKGIIKILSLSFIRPLLTLTSLQK